MDSTVGDLNRVSDAHPVGISLLLFDGSIGSWIENPAHLTVALRRAFAAIYACALVFARACSYLEGGFLAEGKAAALAK